MPFTSQHAFHHTELLTVMTEVMLFNNKMKYYNYHAKNNSFATLHKNRAGATVWCHAHATDEMVKYENMEDYLVENRRQCTRLLSPTVLVENRRRQRTRHLLPHTPEGIRPASSRSYGTIWHRTNWIHQHPNANDASRLTGITRRLAHPNPIPDVVVSRRLFQIHVSARTRRSRQTKPNATRMLIWTRKRWSLIYLLIEEYFSSS
jgi:hypothetical protein